ncbi:MAG: hypothetical protein Q8J78_09345 [Moraxellaceae bacterium]|nr:hypothetical protein [Moraxellaceae bacterium]
MLNRVTEALYFFRQHWLALLLLLGPVLVPLSIFQNHRFHVLHGGDIEKAAADGLALGLQLFGGILANTLTILYCLHQLQPDAGPVSRSALWQQALPRVPGLFVVQILTGIAVFGGLMLLIVPGVWLIGVFMPAYVLVVAEHPSGLEALRRAWARFRPGAWMLAGSMGVMLSGLLLVLSGFAGLERGLAGEEAGLRWVLASLLDIAAMLCTQVVAILLVRFYDLERSANPAPPAAGDL